MSRSGRGSCASVGRGGKAPLHDLPELVRILSTPGASISGCLLPAAC